MLAKKMFVAPDGQGLLFDQAEANAVGALYRHFPDRTEPKTGSLEFGALGLARHAIDHYTTGAGKQYGPTTATHLLMQAVHLRAGNANHLMPPFPLLIRAALLHHPR